MPKQRRVKKPDSAPPTTAHALPMELHVGGRLADETGEWEIISRPYTTNAGRTPAFAFGGSASPMSPRSGSGVRTSASA
jgi:hypothetical protein